MKNLLLTTLLTFVVATFLPAQFGERYRKDTYTVGLNGGKAYQNSDVKAAPGGFGAGLTVGKSFGRDGNFPVALDLRSRLLYTQTRGLDFYTSDNILSNDALNGIRGPDYLNYPESTGIDQPRVFHNYQTRTGELGVEAMLHLNQLRKNTGVIVGVYGGLGAVWNQAKVDQLDANGNEYYTGYANTDEFGPKDKVLQELRESVLDGYYETTADGYDSGYGDLSIMPSAGIELGMELTPNLSLVGGHRMTFSGQDKLDGQQWKNADKDLLHYTNIGLQFSFDRLRGGSRDRTRNRTRVPRAPRTPNTTKYRPLVNIYLPGQNSITTTEDFLDLRATVDRVENSWDVFVTVNGRSVDFDLYGKDLRSTVPLEPGNNKIVVSATNRDGRTEDVLRVDKQQVVVIIDDTGGWNNEETFYRQPEVRWIRPGNATETEAERIALEAEIRYASEVELWINGQRSTDFTRSGDRLLANVALETGENYFTITAHNNRGTQNAERSVIRKEQDLPIALPTVRFTNPGKHGTIVEQAAFEVTAEIGHIAGAGQLQFFHNDRRIDKFTLDAAGKFRSRLELAVGENFLKLIATNNGHTTERATYLKYELIDNTPVVVAPETKGDDLEMEEGQDILPTVDIQRPIRNSVTVQKRSYLFLVDTRHVEAGQISIVLNGKQLTLQEFQPNSGRVRQTLTLKEGRNIVDVVVENNAGRAGDRAIINYERIETPAQVKIASIGTPKPTNGGKQARVSLRATTKHLSDKDRITLTLNGKATTDFRFDAQRGLLTADLLVEAGTTVIKLTAENRDGADTDTEKVLYVRTSVATTGDQPTDGTGPATPAPTRVPTGESTGTKTSGTSTPAPTPSTPVPPVTDTKKDRAPATTLPANTGGTKPKPTTPTKSAKGRVTGGRTPVGMQ